jgi:hypothetical protein
MSIYTQRKNREELIKRMMSYYGLSHVHVNYDQHFANRSIIERKRLHKKKKKKIFYLGKPSLYKSAKKDIIYAEYVFDNNSINLNPRVLNDDEEFVVTLLHEINHALDGQQMGVENFEDAYFKENDFYGYDNNKYELKAESWAKSESHRWL